MAKASHSPYSCRDPNILVSKALSTLRWREVPAGLRGTDFFEDENKTLNVGHPARSD